jgi:hypothetical protein
LILIQRFVVNQLRHEIRRFSKFNVKFGLISKKILVIGLQFTYGQNRSAIMIPNRISIGSATSKNKSHRNKNKNITYFLGQYAFSSSTLSSRSMEDPSRYDQSVRMRPFDNKWVVLSSVIIMALGRRSKCF